MRRVFGQFCRTACLVLAAAVASALLVHFAPGADVDERELNQKLSADTIHSLRAAKESGNSIGEGVMRFFRGLLHGDLGYSASNHSSVSALIADRAPETLRELAAALPAAWVLALALALPAGALRGPGWKAHSYHITTLGASGLLLSLPATLIALLFYAIGVRTDAVLAVILAPRLFRYARNLIAQAYESPHVGMARARGIGEWRILCLHVLLPIGPQLAAVAAASASMAIDATIPVEAICDVPGLGRLAWQAATARDMPLLVNLSMLIAAGATAAMALSEFTLPSRAAR
jgi:peptide/nickel transport system permease protein